MGRWNKDLMARLVEPIELARGEGAICYACLGEEDETSDKAVRLVVAAKWFEENEYHCPDNIPDDVELVIREIPHTHNEGCEQGGRYVRVERTAEYLCPQCGLVYANSYEEETAGPNLFLTREEAKRWLDDLPPDAPVAAGPRLRGFRVPPDTDDEMATRLFTVITPKRVLQKHRQSGHIPDQPES